MSFLIFEFCAVGFVQTKIMYQLVNSSHVIQKQNLYLHNIPRGGLKSHVEPPVLPRGEIGDDSNKHQLHHANPPQEVPYDGTQPSQHSNYQEHDRETTEENAQRTATRFCNGASPRLVLDGLVCLLLVIVVVVGDAAFQIMWSRGRVMGLEETKIAVTWVACVPGVETPPMCDESK